MRTLRIYVAGHRGMVDSAIVRTLLAHGVPQENIITLTLTHAELDLSNQAAVQFFADERLDQVYLAASKVVGIHANNTYLAEFIYQNLMLAPIKSSLQRRLTTIPNPINLTLRRLKQSSKMS
jgi:GDP-L-fucose synthase